MDDGAARKAGHQHDWNQIEILARPPRIQLAVNGMPVADWTDPQPDLCGEGPLGLQLHANKVPQEVRFRGLVIAENPGGKLITAAGADAKQPTAKLAHPMAQSLRGRTALITGASKGLGKAMALALAEAGASIALVSRDESKLESVAKQIRDGGGCAEVFVADVTDEAQIGRVRDAVVAKFGDSLQILINNAGINIRKPLIEFTLAEWHSVMDTNVTSVFLLCRALVPLMKGQGYGRIINMTSMMSHISLPGRTAYSSSKTALLGFNRALALELAGDGITVNGISPGVCDTEINAPLMQNAELRAQFLGKIPAGRFGRPDEIGKLAVYLCSEDAGFITGTDIVIDGGWTAQ